MDTNKSKRNFSLREICEEVNRKWEENKAQSALNSTQSMIKFLLNQRNQYRR